MVSCSRLVRYNVFDNMAGRNACRVFDYISPGGSFGAVWLLVIASVFAQSESPL